MRFGTVQNECELELEAIPHQNIVRIEARDAACIAAKSRSERDGAREVAGLLRIAESSGSKSGVGESVMPQPNGSIGVLHNYGTAARFYHRNWRY